jgi:PEP-CTERM motif
MSPCKTSGLVIFGAVCLLAETIGSAHAQMFDFVYHNGVTTQFDGPLPQFYSDLSTIYGPYTGPGFIYSNYVSADDLALRDAYVAQFPGSTWTAVSPAGSNQLGQTVGTYDKAWVYSHGVFINNPPGIGSDPQGINDKGQIVGSCSCGPDGTSTGFLDNNGVFSTLSVPGAYGTGAFAINDAGLIVGDYLRTADSTQLTPFVYDNGNFITIATYGVAVGVNDAGDVMGFGTDVPEPATWILMAMGFAAMWSYSVRVGPCQLRPASAWRVVDDDCWIEPNLNLVCVRLALEADAAEPGALRRLHRTRRG